MKEYLKVKECFNPVIVQTKKATCHRALYPNDPLLQPDQEMVAQTQFLPSLIRKNSDLADKMRELFNIKKGMIDRIICNPSELVNLFFHILIF